MESFFGYGTASSAFDGRRHVNVLTHLYATYQLMANSESIANIVRTAIQMSDSQSAVYLKQNLFGRDFLQFIDVMARRFSLNEDEINIIMSKKPLLMSVMKTPAGYDRNKNIGLAVDIAYLQKYFGTINAAAYGQFIRTLMPMFKGMKGNITESDVNKIFSMVSSKLRAGVSDLSAIESFVINSL